MEYLQSTAYILEISNWLNQNQSYYEYPTILKEEMAAFSTIVTEKDNINLHTRFFEAWPT